MRKFLVLGCVLIVAAVIFLVHAAPTIHLIDLNDVDPTGLQDGQVLVWSAPASKFIPFTIPSGGSSGGGGTSIGNSNGSASIDAAGNLVISGRLDSIGGFATAPDPNGFAVSVVASGFNFVGQNIGGTPPTPTGDLGDGALAVPYPGPNGGDILYHPRAATTDPASWIDSDWTAEVVTPGTATSGLLRVAMSWQSPDGTILLKDVLTGFDITQPHNWKKFELGCIPHLGKTPASASYGIWFWATLDSSYVNPGGTAPLVHLYPHIIQH